VTSGNYRYSHLSSCSEFQNFEQAEIRLIITWMFNRWHYTGVLISP